MLRQEMCHDFWLKDLVTSNLAEVWNTQIDKRDIDSKEKGLLDRQMAVQLRCWKFSHNKTL